MATKTWAGRRHTVAWSAGSRGWGARGPRIETRGSHHIIAHPISRQIAFLARGLGLKSTRILKYGIFSIKYDGLGDKIREHTEPQNKSTSCFPLIDYVVIHCRKSHCDRFSSDFPSLKDKSQKLFKIC